jgi:hypothetical protein
LNAATATTVAHGYSVSDSFAESSYIGTSKHTACATTTATISAASPTTTHY